MTEEDLTDLEALAAEYALGVLDHADRRRAQELLRRNPEFEQMVLDWEQRLLPLSEQVTPVEPPASLWDRIEEELGPAPEPEARSRTLSRPQSRPNREAPPAQAAMEQPWLLDRIQFWKRMTFASGGLAAAATMAALVVAIFGPFGANGLAERYVAVLNTDDSEAALVVTIDPVTSQMTVRPVRTDAPSDQTMQLWLVADETPHSLGLLNSISRTSLAVDPKVEQALRQGVLAVSFEPPGGSPTGQPTGPVVYHGQVLALDD